MNRRSLLVWISTSLGSVATAIVALPGASFVWDTIRRRDASRALVQRVARWQDLRPGKPVQVPVIAALQDAWTMHPDQVVGRVWLVRGEGESASPQEAKISAFAATCPHLGCAIHHDRAAGQFVCPCHRAAFATTGEPIDAQKLGHTNHAPRAMDSLDCHVVVDDATGAWWVEVKYEQFEQGLTSKVAKA